MNISMTNEQKRAYEWAMKQNFQSVAARYAKVLAELVQSVFQTPVGNPLTLDQMREMEGEKVLLYRMKSTEPMEPGTVKQNGDVLGDAGMLAYHELYLETWVAFSYIPSSIDREAWEPCEWCGTCESCKHATKSPYDEPCLPCLFEQNGAMSKFEPAGFCKYCGRPLTPEAWAMLEKRLRG